VKPLALFETEVHVCGFMTPSWFATMLMERYWHDLTSTDLVIEPACGTGSLLGAVPEHVTAIGVEIDAALADVARSRSGRRVITGDFRTVALDVAPTVIIANPPFRLSLIDDFLTRALQLLPEGGRFGSILPTYALQTASRICRYLDDGWSLSAEFIPRNVFKGLQEPLAHVTFRKDGARVLVGLALYAETHEVLSLSDRLRRLLDERPRQLWKRVIDEVLSDLGGTATVDAIYRQIQPVAPPSNQYVREQIRKVLGQHFVRRSTGVYAFA
jgi:site-specific DNA-methyltransferase (adenine-specific)